MLKVGILILADTESHADMGRVSNALIIAKEFIEAGDEVKIIFDGAGSKWVTKLTDTESPLNPLYNAVQDKVDGVCSYCAAAFGVKESVEALGLELLEEYQGHPSLRKLVADGYQIITF
ncbi:hypothetical protein LCGC14_2454500 [marine sediment metagenome]|uniref:Uncharacterized protein n=1 Tax=marine sediment metagenome TaxID=412755 RepID=A0A0F9BFK7_9ZZZZ